MNFDDLKTRLYIFCSQHRLLRPITSILRLIQVVWTAHNRSAQLVKKISRDPGLPCSNPTSSYWQDPPHKLSKTRSISLPKSADLLIIGSGMTAASLAYYLLTADPQVSVVIAEARDLCSGATGRNGGHILELPYEEYDMQISMLGKENTRKLVQFRLDHFSEMSKFAKECMTEEARKQSEIRPVTVVDAVYDLEKWEHTKRQFRHFIADFPQLDGMWRIWEAEAAQEKFGLANALGAVTGPAGAVWPYRFVTNVFEALVHQLPKRISIETNTPVRNIAIAEPKSDLPYISNTPRGVISSRAVVHATNGHVGHLLPCMRGKIVSLRGQMTVQKLPDQKDIKSQSWILEYGKGYNYMTQNASTGEYFLGGGFMQGGNSGLDNIGNPEDNQQDTLALCHLHGVLPHVFKTSESSNDQASKECHGSILKSAWTGILGYSCDGRPWVGKLPSTISERRPEHLPTSSPVMPGEWIAAGFCGNGMVYCWRTGQAVASMIWKDETPEWFPESLLPTERRFQSSVAEDIAAYWLDLSS